jgi:Ca2+-binding EF-hand superfamily protein
MEQQRRTAMKRSAWLILGGLVLSGTALAANVDKDFKKLDTNKDGYISMDEAKENPLLARHFYKFDTRQTGQLDKSEFSAFESMRKDKLEPYILRHEWYGGVPPTQDSN